MWPLILIRFRTILLSSQFFPFCFSNIDRCYNPLCSRRNSEHVIRRRTGSMWCHDWLNLLLCRLYSFRCPHGGCWGCDCPSCGSPRSAAGKESSEIAYLEEKTLPIAVFFTEPRSTLLWSDSSFALIQPRKFEGWIFPLLSVCIYSIRELSVLSSFQGNPYEGGLPRTTYTETWPNFCQLKHCVNTLCVL